LQSASQLARTFTSALQLASTLTTTVTPAARALSTRAFTSAQARFAVSRSGRPRLFSMPLQASLNFPCASSALIFNAAEAFWNASTFAFATDVLASSPSQPAAASFTAEQPLIADTLTARVIIRAGTYFKLFIRIIRSFSLRGSRLR